MKRVSRLFIVVALACSAAAAACSSAPGAGLVHRTGRRRRPPRPTADKEWTMPNKNTSATRYSGLSEINTENVKNLKVAWTFSTGVLRGHEGEPLVVGSTMYVHTPFPNIVYALDLSKEGAPIKWKYTPKQDAGGDPDRLLRHRQPRRGLRRRQDLPEPARHQHRGARCRDRQGAVEGQAGRLQAGPDDHRRRRW